MSDFNWNQPPAGAPLQPLQQPQPGFGQPQPGFAPQQAFGQPQPGFAPQQAFGGPPGMGGMTAQQALAGFGDAPIDVREPFLPVGFAGMLELLRTYGKTSQNIGYAIYIIGRVVQIAVAGGGEAAAQQAAAMKVKNPNVVPAAIGNVYAMRIDGFGKQKSDGFARSELKLFLLAAAASKGLRADNVPAERWNQMALAADQGALRLEGERFCVQSTIISTQSGFGKVKVSYHPAAAMTQG